MTAKIGLWEHFRKLASFRGREDRASFWPYAALVFGIVMVAASVMLVPMMVRSMRAMEEVRHADQVSIESGPDQFSVSIQGDVPNSVPATDLMPSAGFLAAFQCVTLGLAVALCAAAVVRRLHDRGKSGVWGLMPLPFLLYTSIQMTRIFDSMMRGGQPDTGIFISIVFSNLLYWIALGALIVLLAGASDPAPNGYDIEEKPGQ